MERHKFKRVFKPYTQWEETRFGLWRKQSGDEKEESMRQCARFMSHTPSFKEAMERVIREWPISCEVNMTTPSLNRRAWLGHAACCIAVDCPEETTRLAWWTLTQKQRDDADRAAIEVISKWEREYAKDKNWNKRIRGR